jgi:hypothetical protein
MKRDLRPTHHTVDISTFTATTSVSDGALTQRLTSFVLVDDEELRATKIKVETNRYSSAARAEIIGLSQDIVPNEGEEIVVSINGIVVFTGEITKVNPKGDGEVKIVAFDAIKKLKKTSISQTFDQAELKDVARYVADQADVDLITNFNTTCPVSPVFNRTSAVKVINQLCRWGDVYWWVNEYNELIISELNPGVFQLGEELIEDDPEASTKEIPYQSVVVYGGGSASKSIQSNEIGGAEAYHTLAKYPIKAEAGQGEPTYTYRSEQILTQRQADNVAQAILHEFQMQRAEGTVGVVGEGAQIRPFDVLEMPDSLNNERYLVSGVKHTFSNDEGFISDVNCGGLVDGT